MEVQNIDLSFLNYRDAVDKAKDAAHHWKAFTKRCESPILTNIKKWCELTEEIPPGQKPTFNELPKMLHKKLLKQTKEKKIIDEIYKVPNENKIIQKTITENYKKNAQKQLKIKQQIVMKQKECRDNFIKNLKDQYQCIQTKIDLKDKINIFPIKNSTNFNSDGDDQYVLIDKYITRLKTNQEIFEDILYVNYLKYGDEAKARCEAIACIIQLGIDINNVNTIVKIPDHFDDPEFELKAIENNTTVHILEKLPKIIETNETIERKMQEEVKVALSHEIELNIHKPELIVDNDKKKETLDYDVFVELDAWLRIHYKNISREDRECIETIKQKARRRLNLKSFNEVKNELDDFSNKIEQWKHEDSKNKFTWCLNNIKHFETNYIICSWLLTLDYVKEFIMSAGVGNLILKPKLKINQNIELQIEIEIFLKQNIEISRKDVEEVTDYFFNNWLRKHEIYFKPGQELQLCQNILIDEFISRSKQFISSDELLFMNNEDQQKFKYQIHDLFFDKYGVKIIKLQY